MTDSRLRPIHIDTGVQRFPEGSVRYACGETRLLIAASVETKVPKFLEDSGKGWVSAEYAMHPRCTPERNRRDGRSGKVDGRSTEIQRLIARSLRAAVHLDRIPGLSIQLDCDVLDADGGTRTAAISGGFVALAIAIEHLQRSGRCGAPMAAQVAAISVGDVDGELVVDLDYEADSRAAFDLNVVGTADGRLIEVQGTAEAGPLSRTRFDALVDAAQSALKDVFAAQRAALSACNIELERLGL